MADKRNHHFVPQFYLRNFSEDGASVSLYMRSTDTIVELASIKGQCQRAHLYGTREKEDALGKLEGLWAEIVRTLLANNPLPLLSVQHVHFLMFLAIQRGRTTEAGAEHSEFVDTILKQILTYQGFDPGDLDEVTIVHKRPVEEMLSLHATIFPLLLDLQIVTIRNSTGQGFVTSDHPIVFFNQLMNSCGREGQVGYQSAGLQILVPISPDVCILLFDHNVYGLGRRQSTVVSATENDVSQINGLQSLNAARCIYFKAGRTSVEQLRRVEDDIRQARLVGHVAKRVLQRTDASGETQSFLGVSSRVPRYPLNLSFLKTIKRRAEEVLALAEKGIAPRHPELLAAHEVFRDKVRAGNFGKLDFLPWVLTALPNVGASLRNGSRGFIGPLARAKIRTARKK